MSEANDSFSALVAAKAKTIAETFQSGASLRIAVLGPGLSNPNDPGSQKRRQILEALNKDGHSAFFPEDLVSRGDPFTPILELERSLLVMPDVDLVIILHTSTSYGTIAELANFVSIPEIKGKTAVLFPSQYYSPDDSLVANTVREYRSRLPYTDDHFRACQLVSECRKWANDRTTDNRPEVAPYGF